MLEKDPPTLTCSCGVHAFRGIVFPEPGVMHVTCFQCGQRHTLNLSVIAAELAWEKMESEAPVPAEINPVRLAADDCESIEDFAVLMHAANVNIYADRLEPEPDVAEPEPPKPTGYKYGGML